MFKRQYDTLVKPSLTNVENAIAERAREGREDPDASEIQEYATRAISERARALSLSLTDKQVVAFANYIVRDILGLGPLEELLRDESITEVMVNGADQVMVERYGKITQAPVHFFDDEHITRFIRRIAEADGRRCDESSPMVNAVLHRLGANFDGSRVNATVPPASVDYPTLTIRKFRNSAFTSQELIQFGTLDESSAEMLRALVDGRMNVVVVGQTGAGKTTILNTLSNFIDPTQRIITIEDTAELKLTSPHVVRMQSRDANSEGQGLITIRDLFVNALRQRPDRIIVGECRSDETLDMLQAMSTGHDGSLTTIHANNAYESITRIQTLINMSGFDLPVKAIREIISQAVDFVVAVRRYPDGSRKISEIVEVRGLEGDTITMEPLVKFQQNEIKQNADGTIRVTGDFVKCGARPSNLHIERMLANNVTWDYDWSE